MNLKGIVNMIDMAKALEILKKYNVKNEKELKQELEKSKLNLGMFINPIKKQSNYKFTHNGINYSKIEEEK